MKIIALYYSKVEILVFVFLSKLIRWFKKSLGLKSKILIAPSEIAGYYKNLCEGFKDLNQPYDFITYKSNRFNYGGETKTPLFLKIDRLIHHKLVNSNYMVEKIMYRIAYRIFPYGKLRFIWVYYLILKYDVFIFTFGRTLLPNNKDVHLIKKMNKKIISNVGHGSEARPAYINGFMHPDGGIQKNVNYLAEVTKKTYQNIRFLEQNSDLIIGAPYSSSQFLKDKFVNWFSLGIPIQLNDSVSPVEKIDRIDSSVRILHSPSHKLGKGTSLITEAIKNLKHRGYLIDFVIISGRPHTDVIDEIKRCDFVVDQVFSDTPLAGFATEAAFFGKPAVVGGYGLEELKNFVSDDMWPPSKICHPNNIEQSIEELIVNKTIREDLGRKSKEFVRNKWNCVEVASRYMNLVNNNIPDNWWLNPNDVEYIEGIGQSVERTKKIIEELVLKYGISSLQLSQKPLLEKEFLKLIQPK